MGLALLATVRATRHQRSGMMMLSGFGGGVLGFIAGKIIGL
ncbi:MULTISPECIES: hypothetical protein [Bradyrhizobium]|nr:hypothetical protein [Bradyrhizobium elkanii]